MLTAPRSAPRLATTLGLALGMLLISWRPVAAQEADAIGAEPADVAVEPATDADLDWPYPRFRPVEYAVAFGTPLVFRLLDQNTREASEARWTGPILLDEPVRDLLVPGTASARNRVEIISDYLWYGSMALPMLASAPTATPVASGTAHAVRGRCSSVVMLSNRDSRR